MVPEVIQQAAGLHNGDNNCVVVNLAHCLSRLAGFHRDIVKDSLTNFILVSNHIRNDVAGGQYSLSPCHEGGSQAPVMW